MRTKLKQLQDPQLLRHLKEEKLDQINDFKCFVDNVAGHAESFRCVKSGGKLSMFLTDPLGKTVVQFFLFQEINPPFGFLQLAEAQKNGVDVPKNVFNLQTNNLFRKWSQFKSITTVMNSYDTPGKDLLEKSIQDLMEIEYLQDNPTSKLILEQLQLILTPINGRRYNKHLLILAAELLCISPAAYRMLRRSRQSYYQEKELFEN